MLAARVALDGWKTWPSHVSRDLSHSLGWWRLGYKFPDCERGYADNNRAHNLEGIGVFPYVVLEGFEHDVSSLKAGGPIIAVMLLLEDNALFILAAFKSWHEEAANA